MDEDVEVSRHIAAAPERVWALVGDPSRIGEISPECYRTRWLGDATAPAEGARFVGWNRKGLLRWPTVSEIAVLDPNHEIRWDVSVLGQSVARWSFRLDSEGDGTRVTQTWQDRRTPIVNVVGRGRTMDSPRHNRAGMERTLDTLRARVEG